MKNLIYYPTFETYDVNWIKFALLYIKELNPIIPESGDKYLSDTYKTILNETDLLSIHRPNYQDGQLATLDAIDKIEKILSHPNRYSSIFSSSNINHNWENTNNHKFRLFEEKYTPYWRKFCLDNKIATETREGLLLSKSLAYLYMTILANGVADLLDTSVITDKPDLDRFNVLTRKTNKPFKRKITVAQNIISLKIPSNIENISIRDIIYLRNDNNFNNKLEKFHDELDIFLSNQNNSDPVKFINSYKHIYNDLSEEVLQLGSGAGSIALGIWLLSQGDVTPFLSIVKEILGVTSFSVGAKITISKSWKNIKSKRFCRKYLSDLSTINNLN